MNVKTIAAVIAESGPEKFGQGNYEAAQMYLAAGGATEAEAQPKFEIAPYDPNEILDLSLLDE